MQYSYAMLTYIAIIFLSQIALLKWLVTFLLGSQTLILIALLFWIYFFLLMLVVVLQWLSLHWEILVMLLSQFPMTFCPSIKFTTGCPVSSHSLWLFSGWSGQPSWSFERCPMGGYGTFPFCPKLAFPYSLESTILLH